MKVKNIEAEIDRRIDILAALNKAMEQELAAISRLKEQLNTTKKKSGIGAQVVANRLAWLQKQNFRTPPL